MKRVLAIASMPMFWTLLIALVAIILWIRDGTDFWASADLRGQRRYDAREYQEASKTFRDLHRRGVAQFRSGDFKAASQTFRLLSDDDSQFNYGNTLVMLGQYDLAVEVYDRVLKRSPNRDDVKANRQIAAGRGERVRDKGGQMTDGKLGADEIVYDASSSKESGGQEDDNTQSSSMSDEEMRGLWLRQVETTPGEFLRAKFAYQNANRSKSSAEALDD